MPTQEGRLSRVGDTIVVDPSAITLGATLSDPAFDLPMRLEVAKRSRPRFYSDKGNMFRFNA